MKRSLSSDLQKLFCRREPQVVWNLRVSRQRKRKVRMQRERRMKMNQRKRRKRRRMFQR